MKIANLQVTISATVNEINSALWRAQVNIWQFIIKVYSSGGIDNTKLTDMLIGDHNFAEWFFNDRYDFGGIRRWE